MKLRSSVWAIAAFAFLMAALPAGAANARTVDPSGKATILLSSYANACGQIGYRVGSLTEIMSAFDATLQRLMASGLSREDSYEFAQQVLADDGEALEREVKSALEAMDPESRDDLWPSAFADLIDKRCASLASHSDLSPLIRSESEERRAAARQAFERAIGSTPRPIF